MSMLSFRVLTKCLLLATFQLKESNNDLVCHLSYQRHILLYLCLLARRQRTVLDPYSVIAGTFGYPVGIIFQA